MNSSIEIPHALSKSSFLAVNEEIHRAWTHDMTSAEPNQKFFQVPKNEKRDCLHFYKAGTDLRLKVKKILKKDVSLMRINTGGKVTGSPAIFHKDYIEDYFYTVVLFTELSWSTQWGGELVVQDPYTHKYYYHSYIPNTAVLLPSNWQHCGFAPNNFTHEMRTTLAFSYIESDKIHLLEGKALKDSRMFQLT